MRVAFAFAAAGVLVGCAKNAADISPSYVSPYQYENFTCPQLADEAQRVSARAAEAAGVQDQKATNDAVATTVGVVIFWPALFMLKGNDTVTADLARLRGEMDAIEQVSIRKSCHFQFQRQAAQAPRPAPTSSVARADVAPKQ
jgi:hypothetical protein